MAWDYPEKLREVAANPRFIESEVGLLRLIEGDGKLKSALASGDLIAAKRDIDKERTLYIGSYGSPACGDYMTLFLLVNNPTNSVEKISYDNYGCTSSIGASEMGARLIDKIKQFEGGVFQKREEKGQFQLEPLILNSGILRELSDVDESGRVIKSVPKEKHHCSVMFEQALRNLLKALTHGDIYGSLLSEDQKCMIDEVDGPLVCHCFDVHEKTITRLFQSIDKELHELMARGESDLRPDDKEGIVKYFHERVQESTKAGGACGKCHYDRSPSIEALILREFPNYNPKGDDKVVVRAEHKEEKPYFALPFFDRVKLIQEAIDTFVRPSLQRDGGDIELVSLEGDTVKVALTGACATCAASSVTMAYGVQQILREHVYKRLDVEHIG